MVAARFIRDLDAGSTTLIRLDKRDERRAREIIFQYADKDFSFTDAASFAVMERLRIPWAFTFDRDFAQYGVSVLQPL